LIAIKVICDPCAQGGIGFANGTTRLHRRGSQAMAFETILINVDSEQSLSRILHVSQTIPALHASQIVGLAVLPPSSALAGHPGAVGQDARRNWAWEEAARAHRTFDLMTAGKPFHSKWQLDDLDDRDEVDALIAQVRQADLIVTSNQQVDEHGGSSFHTAERLVVESGRPVLLVPRPSLQDSCGRRVLIAWNGSREATRAVFDALPLFQSARHVKVLQVHTGERSAPTGLSGTDMCCMLDRHGVRATAETLALPRATAGAALLSATKAENADLLVMGGYGHWRLRELVLGDATHHVLRNMTVPVLMSH
jgi:nucleotide-binding universal stress UspA family protein